MVNSKKDHLLFFGSEKSAMSFFGASNLREIFFEGREKIFSDEDLHQLRRLKSELLNKDKISSFVIKKP